MVGEEREVSQMAFFKKGQKAGGAKTEQPVNDAATSESPKKKGLFSLGGGGKPKKDKGKKKKRGKKADLTHVAAMGLSDSVAEAAYAEVYELSEASDTAIRVTPDSDYFVIVAVTNDMFEQAELPKDDEDFGAFATAIAQASIKTITLKNDLEDGIIGIIPDSATLEALQEYDFAEAFEYRWALLPQDIEDDGQLVLMQGTVTLNELFEMSSNQDIQVLEIANETVVLAGGEEEETYNDDVEAEPSASPDYGASYDDPYGDPGDDTSYDEDPDAGEDEFDDNPEGSADGEYDGYEDNYDETGDGGGYDDSYAYDNDGDAALDMGGDYDDGEDDGVYRPNQDQGSVYDEVLPEDARDAIDRVTEHAFMNSELDLKLDMKKFDEYFGVLEPKVFDLDVLRNMDPNDKLVQTVYNMRTTANMELTRYHEEMVNGIRSKFVSNMRRSYDAIVESLDHYKEGGQYASRFAEIKHKYDVGIKELDRLAREESDKLRAVYNENREAHGEAAKNEAMLQFDQRNKAELDDNVLTMRDRLQSGFEAERDAGIAELHQDRRRVGATLFDKALTGLLMAAQSEYSQVAAQELQLFDRFRRDYDQFSKDYYDKEVMRQKAEAAAIRQSDEVAAARKEYMRNLEEKQSIIDEADQRQRRMIEKFEEERRQALERQKQDFERLRQADATEIEELNRNLIRQSASVEQLIKNATAQSEGTIAALQATVSEQKTRLELEAQHQKDAKKPSTIMFIAVATVALLMGLGFGLAYGLSQANIAPSTASKDVGYTAPANVYTLTHEALDLKAYSRAS